MSVIRLTPDEREFAVEYSSRELVDNLPDELGTWLIDGRLTPPNIYIDALVRL
jgi:hypothetical protein